MNSDGITAASLGLRVCHVCGLISRPPVDSSAARCPRCAASLHERKHHGTEQCWALLIAAYILYLPANMLTIMETGFPGQLPQGHDSERCGPSLAERLHGHRRGSVRR